MSLDITQKQNHEAGAHNLLEIDPVLNAFYTGIKMLMGTAYLWFLRNSLLEIGGIVAFALLVRFFAEGTFTIALIGAMMGRRMAHL